MRIDAHQHFWQYNPAEHVWMTSEMAELKHDFLPPGLKPLLDRLKFDGSYERGCHGKISSPSSPRGDGCGDLHPAQSEIWRGFVFATCYSQTQAIDGVGSTVSYFH